MLEDLDLARVEAEALVDAACLRLQRAVVGQEDAGRAALDQRRRDGRALDVGQRLGGEHHGDVLLAQRLEPLADARGEQRVVEEGPGLVEDRAASAGRRSAPRAGGTGRSAPARSAPCAASAASISKCSTSVDCQLLRRAVEQPAVGAFQRVGRQRRHQRTRLDQHGEAGQRALRLRAPRRGSAARSTRRP